MPGVSQGRPGPDEHQGGSPIKVLTLDIETTPLLVYTWSLRPDYINPNQIVKPSGVLCWAAKWLGDTDVEFRGVKPDGRKRMIRRMWKLLDAADAVLHYNGKRFDIPHLQRLFLEAELGPPAPYKQIDLLQTARRQFRFDSNKLEQVGKELGIGRKLEHSGFRLWERCLAGEGSAWDEMRRYNVHDVRLTERAYLRLRPWIASHPSHAAVSGRNVCTKCGSARLVARGFAFLTTGRYQRFQCKECLSWGRATRREPESAVEIRELAA